MTRKLPLRRNAKPAFTLIELLVVISIIALLIAILLPALGSARNSARISICSSNTRQCAMGIYSYTGDRKGVLPPYQSLAAPGTNVRERHLWTQMIYDYVDGNETRIIGTVRYTDSAIYLCPETKGPGLEEWIDAGNGWIVNDPNDPWYFVNNPNVSRGGYAMNGYMYTRLGEQGNFDGGPGGVRWAGGSGNPYLDEGGWPDKMDNIINASERPIFSDGRWVDGWPRETDTRPSDDDYGNFAVPASQPSWGRPYGMMTHFLTNHHGDRTNVSFMDGHSETIRTKELYDIKWTRTWGNHTP